MKKQSSTSNATVRPEAISSWPGSASTKPHHEALERPSLTGRAIEAARARARRADAVEPRVARAWYDRRADRLRLILRNGVQVAIPRSLIEGLVQAQPSAVARIEVTPSGEGLHWEALDVDLSVLCLLLGVFGTKSWMAEIGRRGGRVSSPPKAAAAKRNGLKGGRPHLAIEAGDR